MSKYQEKMNSLHFYFVEDKRNDFANIENIEKIEDQLNLTLPNEYKDFLIHYGLSAFNKGYVYFPILGNSPGGNRGILEVFFGIFPEDCNDIVDNYESYQGRIPPELLPIAGDPGGNIICMLLSKDSIGKIYFWDHEEEIVFEQNEKTGNSNLYLIANSFDEFMNSLELELDEAL